MDKTKGLNTLLIISGLFITATVFSDVFVDIYIWRLKNDFVIISRYQLIMWLVIPFIFYLSGFIAPKTGAVTLYRAGIVFFLVFYLLALLLNERVPDCLLLLGVIKGTAMGLYWFAYHVISFDYTKHGSRDRFYSVLGILGGIASIIIPPVSGFIISKLDGFRGYYAIFICSLVLFLAAIILSGSLKPVASGKKYIVTDLIFPKDNKWRGTMIAYFIIAGRDMVAIFLISILVYRATGSELSLGKYIFFASGAGVLMGLLMAKYITPKKRPVFFLWGCAGLFLSSFLLMFKINFTTLLLYGIFSSVASYLVAIPLDAHAFDLISRDANSHERKMEYIVAREVPMALGRVLTCVAFIIFIAKLDLTAVKAVIFITSLIPISMYWFLYRH